MLLSETSWGSTGVEPRLAFGAMARAAKRFGLSRGAISNFWKAMKERYQQDGILSGSPTKKRTGRPPLYSQRKVAEAIQALSFAERRSIGDLAKELGMPKSTLARIIKHKDEK